MCAPGKAKEHDATVEAPVTCTTRAISMDRTLRQHNCQADNRTRAEPGGIGVPVSAHLAPFGVMSSSGTPGDRMECCRK